MTGLVVAKLSFFFSFSCVWHGVNLYPERRVFFCVLLLLLPLSFLLGCVAAAMGSNGDLRAQCLFLFFFSRSIGSLYRYSSLFIPLFFISITLCSFPLQLPLSIPSRLVGEGKELEKKGRYGLDRIDWMSDVGYTDFGQEHDCCSACEWTWLLGWVGKGKFRLYCFITRSLHFLTDFFFLVSDESV